MRLRIASLLAVLLLAACSGRDEDLEYDTARLRQPLDRDQAGMVGDPDGLGLRSLAPIPMRSGVTTTTDRARHNAIKAVYPSRKPAPPALLPTEDALAKAEASTGNVFITVELYEAPGTALSLVGADDAARKALIETRKSAIRGMQDMAAARIAESGGSVLQRFWLTNELEISIPGWRSRELLAVPGLRALHWSDHRPPTPAAAYTGIEARDALLTSAFVAADKTGWHGNRATGGIVRVAIFEGPTSINPGTGEEKPNYLYWDHRGFQWAGSSRVKQEYNCTATGCVFDDTLPCLDQVARTGCWATHATAVAGVLAGSIEAGQDPIFVDYPQTVQLSGQARMVHLYFFRVDSPPALKAAIETAVNEGIDVANYSMGFPYDPPCAESLNASNLNETLAQSFAQGILHVFSPGNAGLHSGCKMWYPAYRPEILAVNGLVTDDRLAPYGLTVVGDDIASAGQVPVTTISGRSNWQAGIAMAAPGVFAQTYTAPNSWYGSVDVSGSSFASPAVAGSAAMLKHAFFDIGWGTDARVLHVNMLAQTDGWDGSSFYRTYGLSMFSGAGRTKMHFPSSSSLVAPWAWGWRSFVLHHNEWKAWPVGSAGVPLSSAVQQWKWALTWQESDLDAVADIDVEVWDTCSNTLVSGQWDWDLRNRIQLRTPEITGRCLEMRAYGYDIAGSDRVVWSADFYHGSVD